MTCTLHGQKIVPNNIHDSLRDTITKLITEYEVDTFFVGNEGGFDRMAIYELRRAKVSFPQISYKAVFAFPPEAGKEWDTLKSDEIEYPDRLIGTPEKSAVEKRDRLIINRADYVVTYVSSEVGSAAKFKNLAEKKKKTVINLFGEENRNS